MTGLWASSSIRRWLSVAAVAAALVGCDSDPVERELVGTWQAAVASASGAIQLRFTTLSNGQYRIDQTGLAALPTETGYFAAADGEWRKENITGGIEQGTYEFLSDDSVLFQSAASGAVVWTRVADATPAAASAPTASSPLAAAPLEPAPGDRSGRADAPGAGRVVDGALRPGLGPVGTLRRRATERYARRTRAVRRVRPVPRYRSARRKRQRLPRRRRPARRCSHRHPRSSAHRRPPAWRPR